MKQVSMLILAVSLIIVSFISYSLLNRITGDNHSTLYDAKNLDNMIIDKHGSLSAEEKADISEYHAILLKGHDIDYRIIIDNPKEHINIYAAKCFEELRVGELSKTGKGLLLVIDPVSDKVRLEVGRNLESVYVDAFIAFIEKNQMIPFFRASQVANGILATTELIITRAQEARKNKAFDPSSLVEISTGAGATASAHIDKGRGKQIAVADGKSNLSNKPTPLDVVHEYIKAARQYKHGPAYLYTKATIASRKSRPITRAQIKNEVKMYESCKNEQLFIKGNYAVVRFDIYPRNCWPYLLKKEDDTWKLDFIASRKYMANNQNNKWFFKANVPPKHYAFAFKDWDFNRNGFPMYKQNQ